MYKDYFGLKELPFSIAPDPRYLFMSEQHQEALAHLVYGINSDGGFVLLTGEVGTGKTTVCRCLLEQAPQNTNIAFILNPKVSVEELLASFCDELRIDYPAGNTSIKIFVDRINSHLIEAHSGDLKTVLIIEEAQNLSFDVLEQVRLLTNLETSEKKLLQIIMLGQPELRDMLSRPELRQLSQRITARFHLEPLTRREAEAYIEHRLMVAGVQRKLFHASAVDRIFGLSGGVPRLMNVLCDRALLGAYTQGLEKVDKRTVTRASQEILGKAGEFSKTRKILGLTGAGIALVGAIALSVINYSNFPVKPPAAAAPEKPAAAIRSRIPPAYKGAVRPGEKGKIVDWLSRRMSEINGSPFPAVGGAYSGSLVKDVMKFQADKGLAADGVVGTRTMMYLIAEDGKGASASLSGSGGGK